jgi:predicted nuclease of predicted toxin-antitoxin system
MRLKLDENIDARIAAVLRQTGHDTTTVPEQGLQKSPDLDLYKQCIAEGRILITLDLDFSNVPDIPQNLRLD